MQIRDDALAAHLGRELRPVYTVWGDEALLAQEAGDAIRAAARAAGCSERQVHTVSGAHFDWSSLLGAAQALSLFAERQLVEIRIPSGKPGKDGSDALQRYCEAAIAGAGRDVITLVQLPRLDGQQQRSAWFAALDRAGLMVRVQPVERAALPQWIAERMSRQGQRVAAGDEGRRSLAFFADRVEGNLLAAHQEIEKLALLYPAGDLGFEQIEAAVLNVARYDVFRLGEAVLAGQTARALRMLDGLRAEGAAAVLVHWTLAEDIRALKRVKDALGAGRPLPLALREARVWGAKERVLERAVAVIGEATLAHLLDAAQICDGLIKGLRHPQWPADPWQGLQRLVLLLAEQTARTRTAGAAAACPQRLAGAGEEELERAQNAGLADRGAVAIRVQERGASRGAAFGDGDPDRTHRLARRGAARPGDAGDGGGQPGRRAGDRALGHRRGDLAADRAVRGDQAGVDAEQLGLGRVRIGNEAALEPVARAGDRGAGGGEQAAGARLGGREEHAAPAQRRGQARDEVCRRRAHRKRQRATSSSVHTAATRSSRRMPSPCSQPIGWPGCSLKRWSAQATGPGLAASKNLNRTKATACSARLAGVTSQRTSQNATISSQTTTDGSD